MIYTVTFNPSIDYIAETDNMAIGSLNRTSSENFFPGGKGINVSLMLNNLGIKSRALGFVAGFTGENIVKLLHGSGTETDFIEVSRGLSRINVKIKSQNVETELNGMGPEIGPEEIEQLYGRLSELSDGDYLVLAGALPKTVPSDVYAQICKKMMAKGVRTIVDASGDALETALEYHPFLIKPNNYELGAIFMVDITKDNVGEYASKLQVMGASNVLVSLGAEGAFLLTQDKDEFWCNAPRGKVISTIGAGDSMVAGFLYGYLEKGNFKDAFYMGICAGSASAFSNGMATKEKVSKLYEELSV